MSIADLNAKIKLRLSPTVLMQLTTNDPSETVVNEDVLNGACADAIGEFQRITGIEEDTENNYSHTSVLVQGVMAFLEQYKSRDTAMFSNQLRNFYAACNNISKKVYISPVTTSNLTITDNQTRPDMDNKKVLSGSRSNIRGNIRQTACWCDEDSC